MRISRLVTITLAAASVASAQWSGLRTKGIPRLDNGMPNLAAPTPKIAEGKPDFSGFWDESVPANIRFNRPPMGIRFRPWADEISRKRIADERTDAPSARCMPWGPTLHGVHKLVQTPDVIVILPEDPVTIPRLIHMDGRALPKEPQPTWWGYSIGYWDGETLVVETIGLTEHQWIIAAGPVTSTLRITERIRRTDFGHLERRITIDDPATLIEPFTYTMTSTLRADDELMETVCENEKDVAHLIGK